MPHPAVHIGPKKLVESAAPSLEAGPYHTTSSALHDLEFKGDLHPWPGFLSSVRVMHENHAWRNECLNLSLQTRDPYTYGNVIVGDESGVQGRFNKYFGDTMNAVFKSQSIRMRFGDFRASQSTYSGIPGVVLMDDNYQSKVIGEFKVPWVGDHDIAKHYYKRDDLRTILAQPIQYMQGVGCVHGFLSNYDQTIFLRQLVDSQGVWRIKYSPVIRASAEYRSSIWNPVVSVRQCLFYVGCEAMKQGPVHNTTSRWVV